MREPERDLTEDDMDDAAVVLAAIRDLFDRDSGRIDNWSGR